MGVSNHASEQCFETYALRDLDTVSKHQFHVSHPYLHLAWTIARVPGLSLCLALLDIVCRSKTHACPRITLCLVCVVPVCHCMNLACFVTTSLNKSLANGSARLSSRRLRNTYTHNKTKTLCFCKINKTNKVSFQSSWFP